MLSGPIAVSAGVIDAVSVAWCRGPSGRDTDEIASGGR